jgi:hypothetical protein
LFFFELSFRLISSISVAIVKPIPDHTVAISAAKDLDYDTTSIDIKQNMGVLKQDFTANGPAALSRGPPGEIIC